MKLKINGNFGQRQSPWDSSLLGYNTNSAYSIGQYGCLITSFGNYIGKNPQEVNDILKANNGFVNGGDFIWSKCTVLGLTQTYQSPIYNDLVTPQGVTKMKSLLDEGKPLICHVDFNPATTKDEMHWLLVMGYEGESILAFDSWTATYITLDVYGGIQRAVIEFRAYDKILPKDVVVDVSAELVKCVFDRNSHWDFIISLAEKLGIPTDKDLIAKEVDKLVAYETMVNEKNKQLDSANTQLSELNTKLASLQGTNEKLQLDSEVMTNTIQKQQQLIDSQTVEIKSLSTSIQDLKTQITGKVYRGWKLALINLINKF